MRFVKRYILVACFIACYLSSFSQASIGTNGNESRISARFRKESLIIKTDATFFNVLIINNEGNERQEVLVELSVPIGWSTIADESRSYLINPGDSVLIPVRAATSKGVEGEIGYSIIAAINSRSGENICNAYCFVKVPRLSKLSFRPISRMSYFDQQSGESNISFKIINEGNITELVYLQFSSTNNVIVENEKGNVMLMNVIVPAKSDTTIKIPVKLITDYNVENRSLYRVDLLGTTQETGFGSSFWFNHLTNHYKYNIPISEKMLVVDLAAQNIFSKQKAYYTGGVEGIVLFPKNRDVFFYFRKYGDKTMEDIYRQSRMRLGYNSPSFRVVLGDIRGIGFKYGLGRGVESSYLFKNNYRLSIAGGNNTFRPIMSIGGEFSETVSPFRLSARYGYSRNDSLRNKSHLGGIKGVISVGQNQRLMMDLGFSEVDYELLDNPLLGYGLYLDYNGKFKNFNIRAREQFGSINYYGINSGRHDFSGTINTTGKNNLFYELSVYNRNYKPVIESNMGISANKYHQNSLAGLTVRKSINGNIWFYGGPIYERKITNSYYYFDGNSPFSSHSAKINLGLRITESHNMFFNPSLTFGYSFIDRYSIPEDIVQNEAAIRNSRKSKNMFNSLFSINIRRNFWGIYFNHFYGPYSVNQEISQLYFNYRAQSIRVMPYFEKYIYKDIVRFSSKLNFLHDFTFKTTRLNLNNQLDVFLNYGITASFLNTLSYQTTTDLITENKYKYSNTYFEARIQKTFDWDQPRIKYHDLKVELFKDLNGNLSREYNEPGVRDILVSIESVDPTQLNEEEKKYESKAALITNKLLSGADGIVSYENLAEGFYRISIESIGNDQGKFMPEKSEIFIHHKKDHTEFMPFLERNKVYGQLVMNRSKLSNIGNIELANIKITAIDSKGRATSTLTDSKGYWEMYVPSVDNYIVSINNIFTEHFHLRQNHYRVNLNGFKQFEVNFIFDEIRRQIEFAPGFNDLQAEIRRLGRTNLSGTVKDANTLQPVRAQIEIFDQTRNALIERTASDRTTGKYSTSFTTSPNYTIVVSAQGYWIFSDKLMLEQLLTIQDAERDILLESIVVGSRFELKTLKFASGNAEIPDEAYPELDRLINQLRQNPNVKIQIAGHSDAIETIDNKGLSVDRANQVMRYMMQKGFSNIESVGFEDIRPIAPNDSPENRQKNRRVEIIVIDR